MPPTENQRLYNEIVKLINYSENPMRVAIKTIVDQLPQDDSPELKDVLAAVKTLIEQSFPSYFHDEESLAELAKCYDNMAPLMKALFDKHPELDVSVKINAPAYNQFLRSLNLCVQAARKNYTLDQQMDPAPQIQQATPQREPLPRQPAQQSTSRNATLQAAILQQIDVSGDASLQQVRNFVEKIPAGNAQPVLNDALTTIKFIIDKSRLSYTHDNSSLALLELSCNNLNRCIEDVRNNDPQFATFLSQNNEMYNGFLRALEVHVQSAKENFQRQQGQQAVPPKPVELPPEPSVVKRGRLDRGELPASVQRANESMKFGTASPPPKDAKVQQGQQPPPQLHRVQMGHMVQTKYEVPKGTQEISTKIEGFTKLYEKKFGGDANTQFLHEVAKCMPRAANERALQVMLNQTQERLDRMTEKCEKDPEISRSRGDLRGRIHDFRMKLDLSGKRERAREEKREFIGENAKEIKEGLGKFTPPNSKP